MEIQPDQLVDHLMELFIQKNFAFDVWNQEINLIKTEVFQRLIS